MITRLLTLIVIVTLALPIATLTPSGDPGQGSWSEIAMAAKGKKHKKKTRKKDTTSPATTPVTTPQFTTVTRAVRGSVTRTFTSADTNTGVIAIPNGAPGATQGAASLYPAAINVNGLTNGVITDVNLILEDFTHQHPGDVDFLLSSSDGRHALVMSDVGDSDNVTNIDLTLDDEATSSMPETRLAGGVFKPTNITPTTYQDSDAFAPPAPTPNGSVALNAFDGADPNGTWRLFVMDDANGDHGALGGWALRITAEVDTATVAEQIQTGVVEQLSTGVDEPLATGNATKKHKKGSKKKGKHRR